MKRRDFLKYSAGASLLTLSGSLLSVGCKNPEEPQVSFNPDAAQPLSLPPIITGGSMAAAYGTKEVWKGFGTNVITLNGNHLGPTVRLQKGATFSSTFINNLPDPSIIHWHGLTVPADMDGHPMFAVGAGESYQYTFPILDRAATYWYHAHPDKMTGKQAYEGLAGLFIVEDSESAGLNLPSGEFDLPLVLQDKRVGTDSSLTYSADHDDVITGFMGNKVFVNGTPNAYVEIKTSLYRLRLVNASNARVYKLAISDNRTMHVIATDGGMLDKPYEVATLYLSPGERAEVLVDFSQDSLNTSVSLISLEYPFESSHRGEVYQQGMALKCIEFRVKSNSTSNLEIPSALLPLEKINPADAKATRTFRLTMDHSKSSGNHRINDKLFDMHTNDFTVQQGDVEIWEFENAGDGFHSMHVHGTQFQILERLYSDVAIMPTDLGWKDTTLVFPFETVRVALQFPTYKGVYLLHCHTLEHEDDGMMMNFEVI